MQGSQLNKHVHIVHFICRYRGFVGFALDLPLKSPRAHSNWYLPLMASNYFTALYLSGPIDTQKRTVSRHNTSVGSFLVSLMTC